MTITDDARRDLYQRAKEAMGEWAAGTLMAHLPPVGWADVATKQDIEHLRVATQKDLAREGEKTDLRFASVHEEMTHLATKTEVAELRGEMRAGFADLRTEIHKTLRTHTLFLVGTNITLFAVAVATMRVA